MELDFFINVPVGLGLLALSPVLLRESRDETRRRAFDPAGAVTITSGLVVLVYAIAEAPLAGWLSGRTLGLLAAAAALIGLFVFIESRSAAPLLRLGIFRSRQLIGGNVLILVCGMSVDAVLFTVDGGFVGDLLVPLLLFGLSLGSAFVAANIAALAGLADHKSGLATGVTITSFPYQRCTSSRIGDHRRSGQHQRPSRRGSGAVAAGPDRGLPVCVSSLRSPSPYLAGSPHWSCPASAESSVNESRPPNRHSRSPTAQDAYPIAV